MTTPGDIRALAEQAREEESREKRERVEFHADEVLESLARLAKNRGEEVVNYPLAWITSQDRDRWSGIADEIVEELRARGFHAWLTDEPREGIEVSAEVDWELKHLGRVARVLLWVRMHLLRRNRKQLKE